MAVQELVAYDLNSPELERKIVEKTMGKRSVLICASTSIKKVRASGSLFGHASLLSYTEWHNSLRKSVFENPNTIRLSDERFILHQAIRHLFRDNAVRLRMFEKMRFQLHELYAYLQFHNVEIPEDVVQRIGAAYGNYEREIFELYCLFSRLLQAVIVGNADAEIEIVLGNTVVLDAKGLDTISNRMKQVIAESIREYDVLILDGFLFFDDVRQFLLDEATRQGKEIYLTNKDVEATRPTPDDTALHYVQNHYNALLPNEAAAPLLQDGTVNFIAPFPNREAEWQFIARQISGLLREHGGKDETKLRALLQDDIAVVLAHKGYEERFIAIFKEVGLFIFKGKQCLDEIFLPGGSVNAGFENVYFTRAQFMEEQITYESGAPLSYMDKHELFNKAFEGITVKRPQSPIAAYPVGQYVFKIYDVLLNGLDTNAFKIILFSNWQWATQGGTKWDRYLSEFMKLEVFFENAHSLGEWLATAERLFALKDMADADDTLRMHPLRVVAPESLQFFRDLLLLIQELVGMIGSVSGGVQEHVAMLKDKVIGKLPTWEDAGFEQKIVMELVQAVSQISGGSVIQNMSAVDFAQNLHAMLRDYEQETETEPSTT